MDKTVCELFAGVGGFRLGLERSSRDWRTVWFSQWEPGKSRQWAHECYVSHWGDIDEKTGVDISLVNKKDIPNHNLLVGGFPCQDYSVARPLAKSKGIKGKKGVLWWQIRDTLEAKKSPFGLFENVDRLLRSPANQRGRDFAIMLSCLAALNYSCEWRVINAADYGCAQRRRRVFVFIYKNNTNYGKKMKNFKGSSIINSEGLFAKAFPINLDESSISEVSLEYKNIASISDEFTYIFENSGYMHNGKVFTKKVKPILEKSIKLREVLQCNVDKKYYINKKDEHTWKYLKGKKNIERTSRAGHKYSFAEGSIAFPDRIDCPARTMLTSEGTKNRSSHLIEDPQTHKLRMLTPVEAERIQGFDDNWTANMPERSRYFCMGNALVVPIITRIADTLNVIFSEEK